ncbi:PRD domain-containing protein [Cellulomonas hominis]|uniref:PRD domain-containing protein n=1 Tax=Cellulomonas hominis TaxID=156981 RepID=UPI0014440A02|nr:PRD domain-containing protein [Cellulomonas hominis]NKY09150.1 PRD domain-containing protein [Cellulomonas hominis]
MRVKQVLNNSVVLGIDDAGTEVILLGPGLGFRTSPGDDVDPAAVQRTFVPDGIGSLERLAAMVEEISIDAVAASEEVMRAGRERLGPHVTARVLIPLADHIGFALRRVREGTAMEYPLRSELSYLYPAELAFGREALDIVERRTGVRLPASEAVPIAMHFVNAQFGSDDMREYVRMTEALQRILQIIDDEHGIRFDEGAVDVARFVTHLRFLFVRARQHPKPPAPGVPNGSGDTDEVLAAVRASKPRQFASAVRIGALLEELFDWTVDADELLYLTLHVARLTASGPR